MFDATNLSEHNREYRYHIADRLNSRLVLVRVAAPPELVKERLASRPKEPAVSSDADWAVYQKMQPTAPTIGRRHLGVDTSRDIGPALGKNRT
ncbi:MAG: AAA family ATPase [Chloroflexota bacterium]